VRLTQGVSGTWLGCGSNGCGGCSHGSGCVTWGLWVSGG